MSEQATQTRDQLRELLFRATAENSAHVDSAATAQAATADVVCKPSRNLA